VNRSRRDRWLQFVAAAIAVAALGTLVHRFFDKPLYLVEPADALVALLPPPAADDTAQTRAELDALLEMQAQRTPDTIAFAQANQRKDIEQFAGVLGLTRTDRPELAKFRALFDEVEDDIKPYVRSAKLHFARRRPYLVESRLTTCLDGVAGDQSYPSGHATYGWAVAYLLSDMLPQRRPALMARAAEFAQQRCVCGVHYPSDLEGGRISGEWLAQHILASPAYRADAIAASQELRGLISH